jgi:hypothetical protein
MLCDGVTSSGEIVARLSLGIICLVLLASGLAAQRTGVAGRVRLEGDWQAKTDDGIRHITVRPDSSAQFGDQVARWRLVRDSLWLTLGDGVWMVYGLAVGGDKLTISGGDLEKPVTLRRVGPANARPDTLAIPAPPPDTARAWD